MAGGLRGTGLAPALNVAHPEPKPVIVSSSRRPAQDEWGFYDPEQAGFEAVMRKLTDNPEPERGSAPPSSPRGAK
jgi:hypothetical protein